ncbi:MAG TPA: hypothetical protein VFG10_18365 [Saprospiraceae bacterium]|nr:hypothetical protein [Saprospiraceae bacterium]
MNCIRSLRLLSILISFVLFSHMAGAQVRPGIKFGLSTPDISPKDFIVTDDHGVQYFHLFVENARYGVHAGAFIQMQIGGFFIQPEILFNSSSIDYHLDSLVNSDTGFRIIRDSYKNIDFPIIMGLKVGVVRLGAGPVGHIFIANNGGFGGYDSFEPFFDDLTWGYQAGIGLDLWKLHIDARYEGNFSDLGEHITFFGKQFDFDTKNNRLVASIGFSF